jgi:hypothetical protein
MSHNHALSRVFRNWIAALILTFFYVALPGSSWGEGPAPSETDLENAFQAADEAVRINPDSAAA